MHRVLKHNHLLLNVVARLAGIFRRCILMYKGTTAATAAATTATTVSLWHEEVF